MSRPWSGRRPTGRGECTERTSNRESEASPADSEPGPSTEAPWVPLLSTQHGASSPAPEEGTDRKLRYDRRRGESVRRPAR